MLNNPLTATDPSGMLSRREAIGALRVVGAIVISVYMPGLGSAFAPIANSAAVTAGFTGGLLAGGLQGAISGAFSAAMFIPIGAHFQRAAAGGMSHALQAQKILAHGIAGGVLSTLQGGQFGHGFASAGLTELFAPGIAQIENGAAQTFVAAIVGGTVSELSGGKFANGAVTAAFAWAFAGAANSTDELASADSGEPNSVSNFVASNEGWRKYLTSSRLSDGGYSLEGTIPVTSQELSEPDVMRFIGDVHSQYSGRSFRYQNRTYKINIRLEYAASTTDSSALRLYRCGTACGGFPATGYVGLPGIRLDMARFAAGTGAHEFGHNLGMYHQANATRSIMSYSANRTLQPFDARRLAPAYQGDGP